MNLASIVAAALRSVPSGIKGSAVITRTIPGTLDVTTGARMDGIPQSFTASSIVLEQAKPAFVDGAMRLPMYHQKMYVAGQDCPFPLAIGMLVTIGTEKWRITGPVTLNPTGVIPVLYELELTK